MKQVLEFIYNLCQWKNTLSPSDCVSILVAIITLIATVYIPKKIKWEQMYTQLLSDYRGYDFGAAIMGVIFFFHEDCSCDVEKIKRKYTEWFNREFKNKRNDDNKLSNDQNLHYQRRLLTQFYYLLDQCARSRFIGKKRVQKDFSSKEANLLKVLYYMNEAASSDGIYMDISTADRIPPNAKSINVYIKHIYDLLRKSKPYIR